MTARILVGFIAEYADLQVVRESDPVDTVDRRPVAGNCGLYRHVVQISESCGGRVVGVSDHPS